MDELTTQRCRFFGCRTTGLRFKADLWLTVVLSAVLGVLPNLALPKSVQGDPANAGRLFHSGDHELEQQHYQAAIQAYKDSAELYSQSGRDDLTARALSSLGFAAYQAGNLAEAERALREAITHWESIRLDEDDVGKITLFEQQAYTYRLLEKVLVSGGKNDAALQVAEQGRARALSDLLSGSRATSEVQQPPSLDGIRGVAAAQGSTLVEYAVVGHELRTSGDEADDETDLFVWVVKPSGEIVFRRMELDSSRATPLSDLVLSARELGIGVRGAAVAADVGAEQEAALGHANHDLQRLYELLITPIAENLPSDPSAHIIFIPQGALFVLPFAALQDSGGTYLLEKHTISIAPSIQTLALIATSAGNAAQQTALVVGNPTMPRTANGEALKLTVPLQDLPGAATEAKAVATLLKTQPLIGSEATKAAVLQRMPAARIIHLATHGLLDLTPGLNEFGLPLDSHVRTARESEVIVSPGAVLVGKNVFVGGVPAEQALAKEKVVRVETRGAIALAPTENDDGFLMAQEIAALRLTADLVVLSACDTGRGRLTSDGIVGLSRAFMVAGVPSVIVSLWALPDSPTASLMTELYRNLQQTRDKAQALRQAMLATRLRSPALKDWAAFLLIGQP